MKRSIITVILLIFSSIIINAQDVQDKFEQANQFYTDGQYSSAIDIYEELLQNGYETPEVYFNLGNSYYKLNDIAYSILYYEKAKK
jgi:tetratricopeptide (TPR) repeat protein